MKEFPRGIYYMIVAAFFFSIMAALAKALGSRIPSQELVLARSLFMVAASITVLRKSRLPVWGRNKRLLVLRGFFGFLGLSAFFYTLSKLTIAESVVIQYTSPLFTALLAPAILKEMNTRRQWLAYSLAFSGIVLIARPDFSLSFLPVLVGLGGACSAGIAYNLVRKLRETDHPLNIILYPALVSIPLTIPTVARDFVFPQGREWLFLLLIGIVTFFAQIFLTRSLHLETAAKSTNVSYLAVVFSTMLGFIFWGEIPGPITIAGAALILSSIYWIAKTAS